MWHIIVQKQIPIVFVIILLTITYTVAEEQVINRTIFGIELGMTLQEASKILQIIEKEDGEIFLMRKYGFGDYKKQIEINKKLGKQIFSVIGNLPQDLDSVELFTKNDIIYQIALHYGNIYVEEVDWDLFTLPAIQKYGQPVISNEIRNLSSLSYMWTDEQTKLEIAKGGTLSDDKKKFTNTIYNVFYTDIKSYNIILIDEKRETEKTTIVPKF